MKLIANLLTPFTYELIDQELMEKIVFIPNPDPNPGSDKLYNKFKFSNCWRDSKCISIDFKKILEKYNYNFDDFNRGSTYSLSSRIAVALFNDLSNYPEVYSVCEDDILSKSPDQKVSIYEFKNKKDNTTLLLFDPKPENTKLQVLPCISIGTYEIEVPSQSAIDYFTSESIYVATKEDFTELVEGLKNMPQELKDLEFIEGNMFLRWEGVIKELTEETEMSEWKIKLENFREEINKVLESRLCPVIKNSRINKIFNKYYERPK